MSRRRLYLAGIVFACVAVAGGMVAARWIASRGDRYVVGVFEDLRAGRTPAISEHALPETAVEVDALRVSGLSTCSRFHCLGDSAFAIMYAVELSNGDRFLVLFDDEYQRGKFLSPLLVAMQYKLVAIERVEPSTVDVSEQSRALYTRVHEAVLDSRGVPPYSEGNPGTEGKTREI